jgi:Protein of unknown function (DUF998)
MKHGSPEVANMSVPVRGDAGAEAGVASSVRRPARRVRRWARAAVAAQVAFTASWLLAAAWQGPRYSIFAHSISDMYAVTAPGAAFLIIVLTVCGAATIWFALRSLLPMLRSSGSAGWLATAGSWLLALSIFGLGNLLTVTERLDCRMADPGCTSAKQLSNFGGKMDDFLSTAGLILFVIAGFLLAAAMKRAAGWHPLVRPTRWFMVLMIVILIADGTGLGGLGGLFERLAALTGAAWIAILAVWVGRRWRAAPAVS